VGNTSTGQYFCNKDIYIYIDKLLNFVLEYLKMFTVFLKGVVYMKYKSCFLVIALLAIFARTQAANEPTISLQQDEIAEIMSAQETYAYFGEAICSLQHDLPTLMKLARASGYDAKHLRTLEELVARGYTTAPAYVVKAAVEEAAACIAASTANLSAQEMQRIADALEAYDHALQTGAADLVIESDDSDEQQTRGTKKFDNLIVRNQASVGSLFVGGDEIVNHNLTVNNDLRVRGNEIIDGNLTVRGRTILSGTSFIISGSGIITGDLKVLGNIKLPNVNAAATQGILQLGVDPIYLYNAGTSNFFAGDYTAGVNAIVTGSHNISIGTSANSALTTASDTIAIGRISVASMDGAVALGRNSRANGVSALSLGDDCLATGSSSIAIGTGTSSATQSVAIGQGATATAANAISLGASLASAPDAIAMGTSAIASNTGAIAVGFQAMATGTGSIALGNTASGANAIGIKALASGNDSLAIGATGGAATGTAAISIGNNATALGTNSIALGSTATATGTISPIAIGSAAQVFNNNAIAIGGNSSAAGASGIALGASASAASANSIAIGVGVIATTTGTFISGIFSAQTAGGIAVYVDSQNRLGTVQSSKKFKENFRSLDKHSAQIYNLNPVKFDYKAEKGGAKDQFGLIAEEVAQCIPEIVARDAQGQIYTVQYHVLPTLLVNEMKHHQQKLDGFSGLHARVAHLEALLKKLQ
jgi:hypothetical protein